MKNSDQTLLTAFTQRKAMISRFHTPVKAYWKYFQLTCLAVLFSTMVFAQATYIPIHNIGVNGNTDTESFTIGSNVYMVLANFQSDASRDVNSKVYWWAGTYFAEVQDIATNGAIDCEVFTIGSDTYLAIANYQNQSGSYNINSKVYKWNGSVFEFDHNIATNGVTDLEFFTHGTDSYLAVANSYNGTSYNIDSKIYKWNGSSFAVDETIATNGNFGWESFTVGSKTYLAVANKYNGSSFNIDSKIYEWDGTSLTPVDTIATNGAVDWESYTIGSTTYLALSNNHDGTDYDINSIIYEWDAVGDSLAPVDTIATEGANDMKAFTVGDENYLAVANSYDGSSYVIDSKIYRWDGSDFVQTQAIEGESGQDWESFTYNGKVYLILSNNRNGTTYGVNTYVYAPDTTSEANSLWMLKEGTSDIYRDTGNVGIGTTCPDVELDVRGAASFNSDEENKDFTIAGTSKSRLFILDANTNRVGIGFDGTALPSALLDVNGLVNATSYALGGTTIFNLSSGFLQLGSGTTNGAQSHHLTAGPVEELKASTLFTLSNSATEVAVITRGADEATADLEQWQANDETILSVVDTGGNFGVGTSNPSYTVDINGDGRINSAWTVSSDKRYKKNIRELTEVMQTIRALRGVSYEYRHDEFPGKRFPNTSTHGFIAQEVKEVLPELVSEDEEGYYGVSYTGLIPLLTEAVKEHDVKLEQLDLLEQENQVIKAANEEIKAENQAIRAELDALRAMLTDICNSGCAGLSGNTGQSNGSDFNGFDQGHSGTFLYQNEPNPFEQQTVIRYRVPEYVHKVAIVIYNMYGEQLKAFEELPAGENRIEVSGGTLAAGTYLYSLIVDGKESDTKRMVLVK